MDANAMKTSPQREAARKPIVKGEGANVWQAVKPTLWWHAKEVRYARSILEAAELLQTGKWFVSEAIIRPEDGSYLILMRVA